MAGKSVAEITPDCAVDRRPHPDSGEAPLRNEQMIDLVYLSKQSLGDRSLELEILKLFAGQSSLYVDRLRAAKTRSEKRMAAHTILGSARGIGAWQVARLAEPMHNGVGSDDQINSLAEAVLRTNTYIGELLEA